MISCDHTITGMSKGGLRETHFSPCNSLQISMCPFSKTMVLIATRLQHFKVRTPSIPAMRWDHRSHDLDGALESNGSDISFQVLWIKSNLPKSTTMIYFMIHALGASNIKPCFSPYANLLKSMICKHLSFLIDSSHPFQIFYLSTRSMVLCPLSRSTVKICFATPGFSDFNSQPSRSPITLLARVHRFLPHVLLKSTVLVHFGTSAFGKFNSSTLTCS
jgi:hypothetical protein